MPYTVNKQRIARNSAILIVSQLASQALVFFTSIQVANYLGVERYGLYTFAFSLVTLFTFVADCGLNFAAFREFSRDRENLVKYYQWMLAIKLAAGLALVSGFLVYGRLTGLDPALGIVLFWCFALLAVSSLNGVALAAFQAWERMELVAVTELLQRVAVLALVLWYVVRCDAGINGLVMMMVPISAVALLINTAIVTWQEPRIWGRANRVWSNWWPVLKLGLPFVVIGLLNQIYLYIDIPLMRFLTTGKEVGIYALAARFVTMGVLVPAAVTSAIFPALNRIKDQELFGKVAGSAFKYLMVVAMPLAVGTTLVAREFILFFFDQAYAPSAGCLQIQIWALALMFGNWVTGYALYALSKNKIMTGVVAVAVVVKVGTVLLLVPVFSALGASVAMVLTEAVIMALELYLLRRYVRFRVSGLPLLKIALCAASMGGAVYGARVWLGLWPTVVVGVLVYAVLGWVFKVITWDEIKQWRTLKTAG
jgi:O-antigen/teichoic acid export membrane protein